MSAFIDILKILIRHPSVVSAEHSFFRILQRELEERGARVSWYEGVLVAQGKNPSSTYFSAHIDRHGLICTGPNEFQYAAFVAGNRSDLLGNSASEELMLKIVDRFEQNQVMAYEPWSGVYRGNGVIKNAYICENRKNLIFELEGLEHLVAGTPVAFRDRLSVEKDVIYAQLDNVISAAALVYLFELGFQGTAFFTAQEEAGKSWRYLMEWFVRFGLTTEKLVVLDTSPYPDDASATKQKLVLRRKDANSDFSIPLTKEIEDICIDLNISYSFKEEYIEARNKELIAEGQNPRSIGSTEMGRITKASNGLIDGTTLQIPTTGYHTLEEKARIDSCEAFLEVLMKFAKI